MFMAGTLSLDPSELTHIRKSRPQKIFKRLLYLLTVGLVSDQQEHETFTAISILQQLNVCLHSLNITNVIRLAKDDTDIYHDVAGRSDDMKDAMDAFLVESGQLGSGLFETLHLVLEHQTAGMAYLIEIRVNRTHDVGTYPIEIEVNGVPQEFRADELGADSLLERFEKAMGNQAAYDQYVLSMKSAFGRFLSQLELAIKEEIRVDHVIRDSKPVMIRPIRAYRIPRELSLSARKGKPFFYGYFGWQDAAFYAFRWAGFVHDRCYHVSDFILVDETDCTLMSVGPIGFEAGLSNALSLHAPFEPPTGGDIALPPNNAARYQKQQRPDQTKLNENRSWFDFDNEREYEEPDEPEG